MGTRYSIESSMKRKRPGPNAGAACIGGVRFLSGNLSAHEVSQNGQSSLRSVSLKCTVRLGSLIDWMAD